MFGFFELKRIKRNIERDKQEYYNEWREENEKKLKAERESEELVEKIDKNPFTDIITNEIEKSVKNDDIFTSTIVEIGSDSVIINYRNFYYFANYNLPKLSLGGQLALAKCIKLRFNKKGYDCGLKPRKHCHISPSSDDPPIPTIVGYEVFNFRKKVYINENVTGSW